MSGNILASEDYVNATEGHRTGDSGGPYETFTDHVGTLYRAFRKEYGRCVGSVHVTQGGKDKRVGWIFHKRVKYDDCAETYLREVWITLHTAKPTVTRTEHFREIN